MTKLGLEFLGLAALAAVWSPSRAEACGCLVTNNVVNPTVQSGERIVFAQKDGVVTAHIQIQYQGAASEFAWLVPVPAVPNVRVGVDELFNLLEEQTAPSFEITTRTFANCGGGGGGGGGGGFDCGGCEDSAAIGRTPDGSGPPVTQRDVVVLAATAGPYEYAVLHADDSNEMLTWLNDNAFVVPGGTAESIAPYVHPGAYFLALKLQAGQDTGAIRPIVLEYASDLPMVPLILTSVAAVPDMGILVWVLGQDRAIPRNFLNVVINDAELRWADGTIDYPAVVKAAVDQAPEHHGFVTEYAGPTGPLKGVILAGRSVPDRNNLEIQTDQGAFLQLLRLFFDWAEVTPALRSFYPYPTELAAQGVTEADYYARLEEFLAAQPPPTAFDARPIVAEIWKRLFDPYVEANQLFYDHPTVTRLYTVLSPEEMTADPVFGFNPDLPMVSNVHRADVFRDCEGVSTITLDDGRTISALQTQSAALAAARIEILREEGPPEVIAEAVPTSPAAETGGCANTRLSRGGAPWLLVLALFWARTRRRSTSAALQR